MSTSMRKIAAELLMDSMGRVTIPKAYRKELGIEPGQLVKLVISKPVVKVGDIISNHNI